MQDESFGSLFCDVGIIYLSIKIESWVLTKFVPVVSESRMKHC